MLLSQAIDAIDIEINELNAQIEAKKQRQSLLIELDALTEDIKEQLSDVVSKIKHHAPEAHASLRAAVLDLFDGDNQPTDPTPDAAPTSCATTQETNDAPYIELVQHPQNEAIAYQCKHDSQIVCVYLGCNSTTRLKSWGEWLRKQDWGLTREQCNNSRIAKRLTQFKYELKLPALSRERINQLALQNFSKQPTMPATVKPKKTKTQVKKAPLLPPSSLPQTFVTKCKFEGTVGDQLGLVLAG
jgi:hypothetical protein